MLPSNWLNDDPSQIMVTPTWLTWSCIPPLAMALSVNRVISSARSLIAEPR